MSNYRRLLAVTILLALLAYATRGLLLPAGHARRPGDASAKFARIEALLKDAVGRKQVAGAAVLVARRGKVWQTTAGWQDAEAKKPLTAATLYRIASMSKPITSVAALMLVEEGKLRVTDPVSKHLPEFRSLRVLVSKKEGEKTTWTTEPARREITVHDLLTHTSGITYRFFNRPHLGELYAKAGVCDGLVETPGTIGDNVKRLAKLPLWLQPGSGFEYGLNTDVLGRLVEVVSGQTLDAFFHKRIFKPLKMNDTYFVLPREKRERLSALYQPGPDKTIRQVGEKPVTMGQLIFSATYPTWEKSRYYSGGAGLVSTLGDYRRFLQMLLNRGELDGVRVLQLETVARMTRDQLGKVTVKLGVHGGGFGYGFGVFTKSMERGPAAGSYSWGGIFNTFFWVDPKNDVIGILMTQIYPSTHLKLRDDFLRLTYEALGK
jgi:CubicO group peptidase (beta-lactamase class C family)